MSLIPSLTQIISGDADDPSRDMSNWNAIRNVVNGSLDTTNLSATAGILGTQCDLSSGSGTGNVYIKTAKTLRTYETANVKYGEILHDSTNAVFQSSSGGLVLLASDGISYIQPQSGIRPTTDNAITLGDAGHRFTLVRGVTITSGDIGFEEKFCGICGEDFKVNEATILKVKSMLNDESRHVPIHLKCADGKLKFILQQPERKIIEI